MTISENTALIVIDAQDGIREENHWGGNRNNRDAEQNIAALLSLWRKVKFPVIIVQHCSVSKISPFRPTHPGNKLMDFVQWQPGEKLVQKSTASAFIKTDLQQHLEQANITSVVITGFVTNNSVEATARNAGDLGYDTTVVSDAIACFDKKSLNGATYSSAVVHELSLANLKDEYAAIRTTKEILHALKSKHPQSTIVNLKSEIE